MNLPRAPTTPIGEDKSPLSQGEDMPKNEGELSKLAVAIERLRKLGVRVTDGTCKGKAIGIVGGVRRSTPERAEDGRDKSSEPVVN
jgi:hypothetical protein